MNDKHGKPLSVGDAVIGAIQVGAIRRVVDIALSSPGVRDEQQDRIG